MFVLFKEEMRNLDHLTIQEYGMSSEVLMEIAGKSSADRILSISKSKFQDPQFMIVCGTGNNGGDGFVIARWLTQQNQNCIILLLGNPNKMSPETHKNYSRCQKMGIPIHWVQSDKYLYDLKMNFNVLVDAVFGIGFEGDLDDFYKKVFHFIQKRSKLTFSIDIPSGINANNGNGDPESIRSDYTLTMASPKPGHYLNRGKDYSGQLDVIDIGIPDFLYKKINPKLKLITEDNISFPARFTSAHKGDYGKIAIIAGSRGLTGAAFLAAQAALRAGGGLITLFHPENVTSAFESLLIEVMKKAIPEKDHLPDTSLLAELLEPFDAILLGPGIGKSDYSKKLVRSVLEECKQPLIIDADAINILAENREMLDKIKDKPILLTPHFGEFSRLSQLDIETLKSDPLDFLLNFSDYLQTPILLKSSTSLCSYNHQVYFINRGNDGLATGGSGDVLAGIIVSFLAQNLKYQQGIAPDEKIDNKAVFDILAQSAFTGSWLLGTTAEVLAQKRATPSIIPSEIIEHLFMKTTDL